jgi:hypothetical protein
MAFGSQRVVNQRQGANYGVQAFQKCISAYKKAGFPSQVNVQCFLKVIIKILLVTFYCIISSVSGLTIRTR